MWIKWRKAEANIKADLETLQECRNNFEQCPAPAARFASIIDEIKARSGRARIETVNRLINASVRYMSDLAQHGVLDRWTAPLATLAAGQGDCEDYAIAKYVAEVGVEAADLRFLLVRDRLGQPAALVPNAEHRVVTGDAEDYSAFEEAIAARAVCCGGCGGRPMTLASSLPIICDGYARARNCNGTVLSACDQSHRRCI